MTLLQRPTALLPATLLAAMLLTAALVTPLTAAAQGQAVTVITNTNLHLRASPSPASDVLATVPYHTALTPLAVNADRTWVRVDFAGRSGWLFFYSLTVQGGSLAALPVMDGQATLLAADAAPPDAPIPGGLFFAIDGFTVPHTWQSWAPAESRVESVDQARFAVYVRNELRLPGLCASGNHEAYLTYADFAVRLVDRSTGATVARRTFPSQETPPELLSPYGRFQEAWAWIAAALVGT